MQSERRRTRPAGSSFCATAKPSVTSRDAMRLRPLTASSSSSTIRRSGTRRTKATSSPSSTHTSARRRGRHALEGDAGLLVQAGAEEVKVVDRGLVLDLDPVLTGLDPFEILTALLHLDAEAGTDLAGQSRRLGVGGCDDQGGCCKCEECHSEHDLPPRVC